QAARRSSSAERGAGFGVLSDGESLASGAVAEKGGGFVAVCWVVVQHACSAVAGRSEEQGGGALVSGGVQKFFGSGVQGFFDRDALCGEQRAAGRNGETGGELGMVEFEWG